MKKRIIIGAVAVALAAVSPSAKAQQTEPAKQSISAKIKQRYLVQRAAFVSRLKDIYFAVGCKVLPNEAGTRSINRRDAELANIRDQAVFDLKEDEELVEAAKQEGLERAAKPGACDYYRRHPDAAEAMRRTADDAAK